MMREIELTSSRDGFRFTGLHAEPVGRRKGGVIVIQEIVGLDRYLREDVSRWADRGYEAVAPALFDRQEPGFVAPHDLPGYERGLAHAQANGTANPISDVAACRDFLAPRGPVFVVGYCYGGSVAWSAAGRLDGLAAVSSYYGVRPGEEVAITPRCPVICHYGLQDPYVPALAARDALVAAHPQVPVYIYEQSGHGFNNDGAPGQDPAEAELARRRTVELFEAEAGRG